MIESLDTCPLIFTSVLSARQRSIINRIERRKVGETEERCAALHAPRHLFTARRRITITARNKYSSPIDHDLSIGECRCCAAAAASDFSGIKTRGRSPLADEEIAAV